MRGESEAQLPAAVQDMSSPLQKIKSKTTSKKMAEIELREGHESVTCAAMLEIISWGHQSNCLVKPFFLFLLSHNPFLAWQISFTSYLYKSHPHPPPPIHELLEKMCGHRKRGPDKTYNSLDIDYLLCWLAIISSLVLQWHLKSSTIKTIYPSPPPLPAKKKSWLFCRQ